jgi:inhibitor of KinA sporulation pathway (predicted exonuclease)
MTESHLLVIDFECTCSDEGTPAAEKVPPDAMEIIEIGAVIASFQGEVVDRFGRFVRPAERPTLTAFCQSLTAIKQTDLDAADSLSSVLAELDRWLGSSRTMLIGWGSWGAFDHRQLERECARKGLSNPLASLPHTNLKARFAKRLGIKQVGMAKALQLAGLPLLGAHHRGMDDALNIARLMPHSLGL